MCSFDVISADMMFFVLIVYLGCAHKYFVFFPMMTYTSNVAWFKYVLSFGVGLTLGLKTQMYRLLYIATHMRYDQIKSTVLTEDVC